MSIGPCGFPDPVHQAAVTTTSGAGILTCYPSTTPFGLALGSGYPWEELPCPGALGFAARKILTTIIATNADILTCMRSSAPFGTPSTLHTALFYQSQPNNSSGLQSRLGPKGAAVATLLLLSKAEIP